MSPIDPIDAASLAMDRLVREIGIFNDFAFRRPESLDEMDERPGWRDRWGGSERLLDPWGHRFVYNPASAEAYPFFVLYSVGPDGVQDTDDDVRPRDRSTACTKQSRTDADNPQKMIMQK